MLTLTEVRYDDDGRYVVLLATHFNGAPESVTEFLVPLSSGRTDRRTQAIMLTDSRTSWRQTAAFFILKIGRASSFWPADYR